MYFNCNSVLVHFRKVFPEMQALFFHENRKPEELIHIRSSGGSFLARLLYLVRQVDQCRSFVSGLYCRKQFFQGQLPLRSTILIFSFSAREAISSSCLIYKCVTCQAIKECKMHHFQVSEWYQFTVSCLCKVVPAECNYSMFI